MKESIKKSFLGNKQPTFVLSVLIGVKSDSVRLRGTNVTGAWADDPWEFIDTRSPLLCERFANWKDTPEGIVAFTRKYGPLHMRPTFDKTGKALQFSFAVDEWRKDQERLRNSWNLRSIVPIGLPDDLRSATQQSLGNGTFTDSGSFVEVERGEFFHFLHGKVTLHVNTLFRLIDLETYATARKHLKVCRFCQTCFIEPDGRVIYCGKLKCRVQGKNESNRDAWHRNKAKWTTKYK